MKNDVIKPSERVVDYKTYNSASEAFKDARYCSAIEKDYEMSDMVWFVSELLWVVPAIVIAGFVVYKYVLGL